MSLCQRVIRSFMVGFHGRVDPSVHPTREIPVHVGHYHAPTKLLVSWRRHECLAAS